MKKKLVYLLAMFQTVEGDDNGDGTDNEGGTATANDAGSGDAGGTGADGSGAAQGDGAGVENPPAAAWYEGIEGLTDEQKAGLKDLSTEDLLAKLAGQQAPESYEFSLPEGIEVDAVDGPVFEQFTTGLSEIAKKHGLSQEAVADIVGFSTKFDVDRQENFMETMKEHNKKIFSDGLATMKTELGAKEAQAMFTSAKATMKAFADEGLWNFLNDSGLGDSPDLIRLFARVGKSISEDSFNPGPGDTKGKNTGGVPKGLYNKSQHNEN